MARIVDLKVNRKERLGIREGQSLVYVGDE